MPEILPLLIEFFRSRKASKDLGIGLADFYWWLLDRVEEEARLVDGADPQSKVMLTNNKGMGFYTDRFGQVWSRTFRKDLETGEVSWISEWQKVPNLKGEAREQR